MNSADDQPHGDLGKAHAGGPESPSMETQDVYLLPASAAQERYWALDRLKPGNPTWMVPVRFRLDGPLDAALVTRAFDEIAKRHESLRTSFRVSDGQLLQVVRAEISVAVPVMDLRHLAKPERDAEVDRLSFEEARRGFDLQAGPLFRASLLRTGEQEHVLLVTPHHAIVDYWSIGLISNELAAIYQALASGSEPVLPVLPVQYGDYAIWQQEQAQSETVRNELAWWKEKLRELPLLEFPTDRPRGATPTYDATITSVLLPTRLTDALREIANREGVTFFHAMLAALAVVLNRYTGQEDFGVATQVAGRNTVELEPVIGCFINTIVLRMDLRGDPGFRELAARVQETGTQALARQGPRFEQLLKELRPKEYPSHHTLFRVNFICQRDPVKPLEFSGVKLTVIPSKSQGALYDLNVFLVLRNEGWRLACEYNTDLFDAATITGLLAAYRETLEKIVENPDRKVSGCPAPERKQEAPSSKTGGAPPHASAEAALATALAKGPERADLCIMPATPPQERFWLLQKLSPTNRAFYMPACVRVRGRLNQGALERAFRRLIERHETLRTTFHLQMPKGELGQVIAASADFSLPITSLEDAPEQGREERLKQELRREAGELFDLARGPLFRARVFRLSPDEQVLAITVHHVLCDAWSQSVIQRELWNIYEALTEGREPQLPPLPVQYADFAAWQREWLGSAEAKASLDFWTKQLAAPLPVLDFPTDRPITEKPASHGEMGTVLLPPGLVQELKAWSQTQDVTMYMLMLACFGMLLSRYTGQEDVLIGSPVANRRPETEGIIGPFAGPVALRLNLAGNPTLRELLERVRDVTLETLPHTEIPFEVLLDHLQVRSLNHRNPLFQFYFFYQSAFLQPREVGGLVVTPMPDFSLGTPFELQFGLMERGEGVRAQLEYNPDIFDGGTIQEILDFYVEMLRALVSNPAQRLSDLAIPARRNAPLEAYLAAAKQAKEEAAYVAPRDAIETQFVLLWERLLARERIGIRDNFFDLGGTSLIAARMLMEIEKAFGKKVDLSTLLTAPTIQQLARHVQSDDGEYCALVPIRPFGSKPPLFCVHGGGGHVLRFRAMAARLPADQPFYGLRSPEVDGTAKLVTIEELARQYVRDIRKVQEHGPYHLSGASFGGLVAFEMASQLIEQGEEVALLALFDTGNPAHYRNLSIAEAARFRALYLADRLKRYLGCLGRGQIREFLSDLRNMARERTDMLVWRVARSVYRMRRRPLPESLRDNVKLFDAIAQDYAPRPYPGRMVLFRAEGRTAEYGNDPALGWDDVIQGGIEILIVPGDHMTILEEPHVWKLVEELGACLERAALSHPLVATATAVND